MPGGVVHRVEHFLRHQGSAEVRVRAGGVHDRTQAQARVNLHGILRRFRSERSSEALSSGHRSEDTHKSGVPEEPPASPSKCWNSHDGSISGLRVELNSGARCLQ